MRGATISTVEGSHDGIAVSTQGAVGGSTYSVFSVPDRSLRERTLDSLKAGADVHEATATDLAKPRRTRGPSNVVPIRPR